MTSPYGPSGGNDPQQWGQQPQGGYPGTPSGGFPAQPQQPPQQWGQPNPYGQPQQPQQPQPGQYQQPSPYGGQPAYPQQQPQQPGFNPYGQPAQQTAQWGQQPVPGQQPQWGQQPGQFGGGFPGAPAPKGNRKGLVIGIVVVAVLIVIVVVVLLVAGVFTKKVFDTAKVEQGVTGVLTDNYKLKASDVKCPDNEPVKAGTTFTCQVTVDGAQKNVQITVKSDDGHYEVGQPQ